MWISEKLEKQTKEIARWGGIKDIEFIRILPEEHAARFTIGYWATTHSYYGSGRTDCFIYDSVDIPYELTWESDDEGDYCVLEDVGLSYLEDVLTPQQVNYIWSKIEEAIS